MGPEVKTDSQRLGRKSAMVAVLLLEGWCVGVLGERSSLLSLVCLGVDEEEFRCFGGGRWVSLEYWRRGVYLFGSACSFGSGGDVLHLQDR